MLLRSERLDELDDVCNAGLGCVAFIDHCYCFSAD
jgi:hypothetical protein